MLPLSAETGPTSGAFRVRHATQSATSIGTTKAALSWDPMYLYRIGELEDRGGRLRAPIPVCVGGDDIELTDRFHPCSRTIVNASAVVKALFISKDLGANDARRPLQIFNPNVQ